MNIKYIFLFGLILGILMIGAVSATENMTDATSLNDIEEASQDNSLSSVEENSEDVLSEGNDDSAGVKIWDNIDANDSYHYIAQAYDHNYVNGTVSLQFDNNPVIERTCAKNDHEWVSSFTVGDLGFTPSYGKHIINITYKKDGVDAPFTLVKKVEFTYKFEVEVGDEDFESVPYGIDEKVYFYLPKDARGVMNIKINGKSYKINVTSKPIRFALKNLNLNVGVYKLEATFKDDANRYPQRTVSKMIKIAPWVSFPSSMSVGEKDTMIITVHKGAKLSVILYEIGAGDKKTKKGSYRGVTKVTIPLEKLATEGFRNLYYVITCGNVKYDGYAPIFIEKNHGKINVDVIKVKDSAKVVVTNNVVTNPHIGSLLQSIVDDKHVYYYDLETRNAKKVFSSLSVGKHKFKFYYSDAKTFYSKTFWITVKKADKVSLSLKKVKIKRSAKKLILKAKVKYNKKPVVHKKIKFKFNGKKYTARTNKYGIAKLKISKKVLKKLKVGKKVVYKVYYGNVKVKKIAKVKR